MKPTVRNWIPWAVIVIGRKDEHVYIRERKGEREKENVDIYIYIYVIDIQTCSMFPLFLILNTIHKSLLFHFFSINNMFVEMDRYILIRI